jgi:hypothetical protein
MRACGSNFTQPTFPYWNELVFSLKACLLCLRYFKRGSRCESLRTCFSESKPLTSDYQCVSTSTCGLTAQQALSSNQATALSTTTSSATPTAAAMSTGTDRGNAQADMQAVLRPTHHQNRAHPRRLSCQGLPIRLRRWLDGIYISIKGKIFKAGQLVIFFEIDSLVVADGD